LKEAVEVKLAKEGEVSVLRKNIEKVRNFMKQHPCSLILISPPDLSKSRIPDSPIESREG